MMATVRAPESLKCIYSSICHIKMGRAKTVPHTSSYRISSLDCLSSSLRSVLGMRNILGWPGISFYNPVILFQWGFRRLNLCSSRLIEAAFLSSPFPLNIVFEILLYLLSSPEIFLQASQEHQIGAQVCSPKTSSLPA